MAVASESVTASPLCSETYLWLLTARRTARGQGGQPGELLPFLLTLLVLPSSGPPLEFFSSHWENLCFFSFNWVGQRGSAHHSSYARCSPPAPHVTTLPCRPLLNPPWWGRMTVGPIRSTRSGTLPPSLAEHPPLNSLLFLCCTYHDIIHLFLDCFPPRSM